MKTRVINIGERAVKIVVEVNGAALEHWIDEAEVQTEEVLALGFAPL